MIKNILLAEDDRGTALLVRSQLESKGYTVYTAGNGVEALKIVAERIPDLIITDVVMPKMDGVDLYNALKKSPITAKIPIIIVTDKAIFKESFASLGVSNFVEKSSDIHQLLDNINRINSKLIEATRYTKILISGAQQNVINQMQRALEGMNYLATLTRKSDEIISKSLIMLPHIILIDVLFQDTASAPEIISALRCFTILNKSKIVVYASFTEDLGVDAASIERVEVAMKECMDAGADVYIGRFNAAFFLERIHALNS